MKSTWILAFCAMSLTAIGCNSASPRGEPVGRAGAALSTIEFKGTVKDADGAAIAGATVSLNGHVQTTNDKGEYAVSVPSSDTGYGISVSKFGFKTVAEHYLADHKVDNRHTLAAAFVREIDPTKDSIVVASSGVSVRLAAGSLVDQQGKPVSGPVKIAIATYDPLAMPGDFTAVNAAGAQVMLSSVGAMAVSVARAGDGEILLLKPGAAATVFIPVPTTVGGMPPCLDAKSCQLAVWRFDNDDLVWIERDVGMAFDASGTTFTMTGGVKPARVEQGSSMGIWNADIEMEHPACTVVEYNMPQECYWDANATTETGITLTFKLPNFTSTLVTDTYPLYWDTRFTVLNYERENQMEEISIEFPPNAPAHCAQNLLILSTSPDAGYPLNTANGGVARFDSGAPWGGTGIPKNTVTNADITFDDLTQSPPLDPCNSRVSFNSF